MFEIHSFYISSWNVWVDGRDIGRGREAKERNRRTKGGKNVYKKPTTSLMAIGTKQQKKYKKNFFITHLQCTHTPTYVQLSAHRVKARAEIWVLEKKVPFLEGKGKNCPADDEGLLRFFSLPLLYSTTTASTTCTPSLNAHSYPSDHLALWDFFFIRVHCRMNT
jgi:hypothetical protein